MLDSQGYLKLVDFGLAKDLMDGSKTFTVVGTVPWLKRWFVGGGWIGAQVVVMGCNQRSWESMRVV